MSAACRTTIRAAALGLCGWCLTLGPMAMRAAAQGCAMCYQNAAASGAQGRSALRHGIWILLIPACSVFLGICTLIYRRRNVSR
jgi:hypothetical protein